MTKQDKQAIRAYVLRCYAGRNGRNVRILAEDAVQVTVDGNGSQMDMGRDLSGGVIFAGWGPDLLAAAKRVAS